MKPLRSHPITPRIRLERVDGREVWKLLLSRGQKAALVLAVDLAIDAIGQADPNFVTKGERAALSTLSRLLR